MKRGLNVDASLVLTALVVLGMALAVAALWPLQGASDTWASRTGLGIVYLAGGVPAAWRAMGALWREKILDIDLLTVVPEAAAAAVGTPFEGAVLLTLFSISSTTEAQARERDRRA